jgi:hypothetical protein
VKDRVYSCQNIKVIFFILLEGILMTYSDDISKKIVGFCAPLSPEEEFKFQRSMQNKYTTQRTPAKKRLD